MTLSSHMCYLCVQTNMSQTRRAPHSEVTCDIWLEVRFNFSFFDNNVTAKEKGTMIAAIKQKMDLIVF